MAMTVQPIGVLPSIPPVTAPLTPRAKVSRLAYDPNMAGITAPRTAPIMPKVETDSSAFGREGDGSIGTDGPVIRTSLDGVSDNEGRMTPVPNPEATIRQNLAQTPRSTASPRQIPIFTPSTANQPLPPINPLPAAIMGFGSLAGEEQLKASLHSKDRIFIVMLSKEIEAFVQRALAGETPDDAQAVTSSIGGSGLAVFGTAPTVKIQSQSTSKFQRMLVYKAAEWYGVKAVSGPDNAIYVGVLGTLPEKSASLKLAALVPEREAVQQKFQIMQRSQPAGQSRPSGSADGGEGGPSSRKTFEEREAEYAAARERIYGSSQAEDGFSVSEGVSDSAATRSLTDDIDPVSRYAYGATAMTPYEPVYASLYHPPKPEIPLQPNDPSQQVNGGYYVNPSVPYPAYNMVGPGMKYQSMGNAYTTGMPVGQQMYSAQQAFDQNGNPIMLVPSHVNGYGGPTWHPQPIPPGGQQQQMQMIPQGQISNNGWLYPGQPQHSGMQQMIMPPPNNNGQSTAIHSDPYGYPMYPALMHPQPTRPQPHQHSSASSSISSQSYQSYSRPQSRGSTTSTRSATSSVRFGQMYPAHAGYRQKGMKGGVNGLTSLGVGQERRNTRGHSPSSNTTTSSRSSRRTNSIALQAPSQHPLPQRPDWAANNIPYEPSAIPLPGQPIGTPVTAQQPFSPTTPLESDGIGSTISGAPETPARNGSGPGWVGNGAHITQASIQPNMVSRTPNKPPPRQLNSTTRNGHSALPPPEEYRRGPTSRPIQALYDPSAPTTSRPASSNGLHPNLTQPMMPSLQTTSFPADGAEMSPEDLIEAKLQALSFSTGVAIGPPPVRGGNGPGPSYAKIVRRDQ